MNFLLLAGAFALVFVCLITVLVILMQRPSANAGMGAALGGGAAEQAFGGEAGNVLTKATTFLIITFFLLSFGLFLGFKGNKPKGDVIDTIGKEDKSAPAMTPAAEMKKAEQTPAVPAPLPAAPAATTTPAAPATTTTAPTAPAPAAPTAPAEPAK